MKKTMILMLVGALAFILSATSILAIGPDTADITFQNDDATLTSIAVETANAQGGNITNLSMNQQVQSSYWHAFYGDIVKTVVLADTAASNIVYDWGAQSVTGWIYFANESGINWETIVAGDATDKADEDASLGLSGIESVVNTLSLQSHPEITDFNTANDDIAANAAFGVNTSNGLIDDWATILLREDATASAPAIYASQVRSANNYVGDAVDYQIMVPVDQTLGVRTYNVYAGLE